MKWSEEETNRILELHSQGYSYNDIAKTLTLEFNREFSFDAVRGKIRREKKNGNVISAKPTYKETVEINNDGTQISDRLIELSEEEMKNPDAVLDAHGYSPNEWEIVSAKSSMWHHFNKKMKHPKIMYASKITVKPKTDGIDIDKLLDVVKEVPIYNIETYIPNPTTYLNIPLADMHFGIADYEYYKPTQAKIVDIIRKKHEEILFVLGNDLLHHNDHRNRTASGREIQQVDIIQAWEDAKLFYYPLLEYAIENSNKVKVMYIKGNHSETLEWTFVQMLKTRYPNIIFDDAFKERKVHMLGLNYIGATHGDKKKMQNLPENFATEFSNEWSKAKTRTIFTGHLHHEKVIDKGGIVVRQLPTGVQVDNWHEDNGYTTAHKRFQIHEYDYDAERCIYYV